MDSSVWQVFNSEKELTEDVVAIDGIVYSLEVSICASEFEPESKTGNYKRLMVQP